MISDSNQYPGPREEVKLLRISLDSGQHRTRMTITLLVVLERSERFLHSTIVGNVLTQRLLSIHLKGIKNLVKQRVEM